MAALMYSRFVCVNAHSIKFQQYQKIKTCSNVISSLAAMSPGLEVPDKNAKTHGYNCSCIENPIILPQITRKQQVEYIM